MNEIADVVILNRNISCLRLHGEIEDSANMTFLTDLFTRAPSLIELDLSNPQKIKVWLYKEAHNFLNT